MHQVVLFSDKCTYCHLAWCVTLPTNSVIRAPKGHGQALEIPHYWPQHFEPLDAQHQVEATQRKRVAIHMEHLAVYADFLVAAYASACRVLTIGHTTLSP